MSYSDEMNAMLYNPLGMFSKRVTEIYWQSFVQTQLKHDFENLYLRYA